MDMYHLDGNAFLGGPLVYLPVATPIIGFISSYVLIRGVEGRNGKNMGGRYGIEGATLDVISATPFFVVYLSLYTIYKIGPPHHHHHPPAPSPSCFSEILLTYSI